MNFKPILFSTEMVKAILSGSKVQTRRIIKENHQPVNIPGKNEFIMNLGICPYGQVGDVLWVRETWQHTKFAINLSLDDDNSGYIYKASQNGKDWESNVDEWKWKPSIFMPKEACRLFLKIKSIRVERLQDISEEDAQKEGVLKDVKLPVANFQTKIIYRNYYSKSDSVGCADARSSFMTLWKSINGEESWKSNPLVWVIEFERIEKPQNFL